jgi:ABC-type polysaccharide/polyol phosphate transport system ATPase subunit/GT2 family glycosyltransferase
MTAVELRGVSKKFRRTARRGTTTLKSYVLHDLWRPPHDDDPFWALREVDLRVEQGTMLGVIGRNGAGKSTLLKVISRILKADAGAVTVKGRVAALIELGAGFHPELTGRENLVINAIVLGLTKAEVRARQEAIIDFAELREHIDEPVRTYSSGMYARLAFSVGVHVDPDVLLIDEVLAVGDKGFKRRCQDRINELKARGKTIILVSHDLALVRAWCDAAAWLHDGRLRTTGATADVIGAYLADDTPRPAAGAPARDGDEARAVAPPARVMVAVPPPSSLVDLVLREIGPTSVLDVGPAAGSVASALRERGVDAVAVDVSTQTGEAPPAVPARAFDLLVCRDLLAHLGEAYTRATIAGACGGAADVLVLPGAGVLDDGRPSFWIELLAGHGFALDVEFEPGATLPTLMRFRRGATAGALIDALLARNAGLRRGLAASARTVQRQDELIARLRFDFRAARQTIGWQLLERGRWARERLLPPNTRRRRAFRLPARLLEVVLDEGAAGVWQKSRHKLGMLGARAFLRRPPVEDIPRERSRQYEVWLRRHRLTPRVSRQLEAAMAAFTHAPCVSVVMRVRDTDERWLRGAIDSVRAQLYTDWELCVVDDASTGAHVRRTLDEYAGLDPRIRVRRLAAHEGDAGADNHALGMASGELVGFLAATDELSADAILEVVRRLNGSPDVDLIYSDEDRLDGDGRRVEPFFKPDWSPDLLLSSNYVGHFAVVRRSRLLEMGGFRLDLPGAHDHDLVLRLVERTSRVAHIPKVLYHARTSGEASPPDGSDRRVLEEALRRRGAAGWVESSPVPGVHTVRYRLTGSPLVSIVIPTRDQGPLLEQCVRSIEERTGYDRYEIVVLDNGSREPDTLEYLDALARRWAVHRYHAPFNFPAICNFGAARAKGDYLLFLNDDTQVIDAHWLAAMLEHAQRPGVGAVGAKLLYPYGRVQHAGVVLGIGGVAGHAFKQLPEEAVRPFGMADCVRNCSAVTAACMMMARRTFDEVQGFDEAFRVAFNDVDLCLRLRERGYVIVYTPHAVLYHHESATRGRSHPPQDEALCLERWGHVIEAGDPYYNPNLTLWREDWSIRL